MLELELPRVSPDSVSYVAGAPYVLVRRGLPAVEWDIGQNTVTMR